VARRLTARARYLWLSYWDKQARRAALLMLQALDDRTLKDIGLNRGEIWPAVFGLNEASRLSCDPAWPPYARLNGD
jgi:uncharacterized protein YjiS (DUF1127 family)